MASLNRYSTSLCPGHSRKTRLVVVDLLTEKTLPTWSWAGLHGQVFHLHFSSSEQGFTGLPPLESLIDEFYIEDCNKIRLIKRRGGFCSIPKSSHPDQQWTPHPVFINQPVLHFKTRALSASCFTFKQGNFQDCRDSMAGTMAEKERATLLPHVVTIVGYPVSAAPNRWLIEFLAARRKTISNRYLLSRLLSFSILVVRNSLARVPWHSA